MTLDNKTIVVAGGTGGVGEGIVRALLARGARVAVPSRSDDKLRALRDYVADIGTGELVAVQGALGGPDDADALRDALRDRIGRADAVVAALGGWTQGPPIFRLPYDAWEAVLRDNLTSHYLAMRALVPLLATPGGTYIHINGTTAEQAVPGAAAVAAMAAAQKSLTLSLAEELRPAGQRVLELILPPINTRTRIAQGMGRPQWPSAEDVGHRAADLLTSSPDEVLHRVPLNK